MGKAFHFLWTSQLFADLGDVLYIVGLISMLYGYGESALYLAMLPFLNTVGRMMSGIFAPLFTNRFRLKSILLATQLGKSIVLIILTLNLQNDLPIIFIFMSIIAIALLDGLMLPVSNSMAPRLVEEHQLMRANSLLAIEYQITQLGGWALGGIFVALTSSFTVILVTSILYLLSICLIACIKDPTPFVKNEGSSKMKEMLEGYKIIWTNPGFKVVHVVVFLEAMANVVWIAAIMYVFVAQVLQATEVWWGYINTAFFVGLLIAGAVSVKIEQFLQRKFFVMMVASSVLFACSTLLFGLNKIAIIALVLSFCCGFFEQIKGIVMHTWVQQKATDEQLVKIYSAQVVLVSGVFGVSALLFGYLATIVSVQWLFIIASVTLIASSFYLHRHKSSFA